MAIKGSINRSWVEAVSDADNVHGDFYKYGPYKGSHAPWDIYCPIHGLFKQPYHSHVGRKSSCPGCSKHIIQIKNTYTQKEFERECRAIYGEKHFPYGKYVNSITPIEATCKKHGKFLIIPNSYLFCKSSPGKCPGCWKERRGKTKILKAKEEFFLKMIYLHPDLDFSEFVYINSRTKGWVKCKICGHRWKSKPNNLLNGRDCPRCNISNGERLIIAWLKIHGFIEGIDYIIHKSFSDCKKSETKRPLPFDVYFPTFNLIIEFDGKHHYFPVRFGGISQERAEENFIKTQINDQYKNQYCLTNNISLLRIPYWDINNIDKILQERLSAFKLIKNT